MRDDEHTGRGQISRRTFLAGALAAGASLAIGKDAFSMMAPPPPGIKPEVLSLRAGSDGKFRILLVTDLHFFANHVVDIGTVQDIKSIARKYKPDLMIPTGDVWHNNPDGQGIERCEWSCEQLGGVDVPWAFVWGNHDSLDDYNKGHAMIRAAENSLYRGDAADGNYRLAIKGASSEETLVNLLLINDSRAGMTQEQVDWFNLVTQEIQEESTRIPPAFMFFHIPVKQYEDLSYTSRAIGVKGERVSYDKGTAAPFRVFAKSGYVKATFCGHDHLSNYWGDMRGVRLEYIRATGYGGYGGDRCRKGATIIDIDTLTGNIVSTVVFADGSKWAPKNFVAYSF
ncbi:MAG TPA: metallophosphoesterase [bacterium]|nr:metallophosphoesterase [bacterium]